ncbi:hypothetical protein [Streptomyces sp. NBC_00385]|uniref:hypothetical protein n=1 Tax=Streptomyces sp. NBC_00385 TaxID=2975733 RepID=UPI002DDBCFD8|nr:hypothetical protein [Streptomyces sp. NBC_00385]WRZ02380.1 hypothetical protein OG959_03000 [Streptomyces sp. NBC_00385]
MTAGAADEPTPEENISGGRALELLDKALAIQSPLVQRNIARARQRNPDASPAEVIRNLERIYVSTLTGTGAAVGGSAAAPGVGTAVGLALSAGEALSSLEMSVLFALSVAEVHGIPIDELERRRTIVMGILLGKSGSATIGKIAERTGQHWGRQVVASVPAQTLRQINKVLGRNFITKYGTKQGIIVLGRVVPFGIGAAIGGGANAAVATMSVRAARRAFGPPPTSWQQQPAESPPMPEDSRN